MKKADKKRDNVKRKNPEERRGAFTGQSTFEFTLAMILIVLMIYALAQIILWAGLSFVDRSQRHEETLVTYFDAGRNWGPGSERLGPLIQLEPNFYKMRSMNAVFGD